MLTIIIAGRNDDYGKDFRGRLFRTALHNAALLQAAGIDFEYMLAEWNPLPERPPLSMEFVSRVPNARTVIVPPEIHRKYTLNPHMPFHEMAAKNAALLRADGDVVIVANADILFSEALIHRIAAGGFAMNKLYRAHRIDVNPELDWSQIQDPANQLPSGEGRFSPPWYLGAGGDFCMAARTLWHSLRGFNEEIRFSTRAKDWQFFLSAAAQGVEIEFIGDVFHLDHDGGFRNTAKDQLNTNAVHFGRWWDIEFGLPVTNSHVWGFSELRESCLGSDPRIVLLEPDDYCVSEEQNCRDREMMTWLTRSPDSPDAVAALLLHTICAAHRQERRLICRIGDPRLAATLSGFDVIASRFSVQILCNWNWPPTAGYTIHAFAPEPLTVQGRDWIFEETECGVRVFEFGSGVEVDVLPRVLPVAGPEFNPLLANRLLRAFLNLQNDGCGRIAICGSGGHTKSLLSWGLPDSMELVAIVDSECLTPDMEGECVDAVLLSSSSFEADMLHICERRGIHKVEALYSDWPEDMWAVETGVAQ